MRLSFRSRERINIYLNEFFDAWQELSANPESYAARISLREQAVSLTGLVQDIYARLDELKYDVEKELEAAVKQVNSLAAEITELNEKITYLQALGQKSNEMLDERDLRLQELSKLVNIRVIQRTNGSVEVLAGSRLLLHDDRSFELKVQIDKDGEGQAVIANSLGAELSVEGGALKGMLESYNEVFPRYQGGLDELVYTLVEKVNEVHRGGYGLEENTGDNFFANFKDNPEEPAEKYRLATRFAVAQSILDDPGNIAAAKEDDGVPGDGSNALEIAQLREKLVKFEDEKEATFHDYFRGMIADLGVEGTDAAFSPLAERLKEQQEAVSEFLLTMRC